MERQNNMKLDFQSKNNTKEQVTQIYSDYDSRYGVWGWCCLNKAGCLIDYIDEICESAENPVCVEIGVFGGKSVLPVALELKRHKKGKIYAIDPWTNSEASKGYDGINYEYWKQINLEYFYNIFTQSIKEFELHDYVEIIRKPSDEAPSFSDINLLYIDGQHTIQAMKDAIKYASNVVNGGYCVLDDVEWGEVAGVPLYLQAIGFTLFHTIDGARVYKRG